MSFANIMDSSKADVRYRQMSGDNRIVSVSAQM